MVAVPSDSIQISYYIWCVNYLVWKKDMDRNYNLWPYIFIYFSKVKNIDYFYYMIDLL